VQDNENPTKDLKFYSKRAIGGATFLGGPLAAGYLIRENYLQLNEPDKGKQVLIYSIIASFLLFGGIFLIPENLIDKIPKILIPAIYTGLISLYVEHIQGDVLNAHKTLGNTFQSIWKSIVIGIISLIIISTIVLAFIFLSPTGKAYQAYDNNTSLFSKNEEQTLSFYDHLDTQSDEQLLQELNTSILPKWKENVALLQENSTIADLPEDLKTETELLLDYAKLRLEVFETFKKGLEGDMESHQARINLLHIQIDFALKKLNQ